MSGACPHSLVTLHNLIHLTRSLLLALQVTLTDKLISSPQQESEVREVDTSSRNSGPVIRWTTCLFTAENQFQLRISSKSGVCGELLRAKKAAHWFSVEKFSAGLWAKWVSEWELTQSWTILYELQYFCLHWPRHMRGWRHRDTEVWWWVWHVPSVLQLTQEDERLCHSSVGPISQFSKHSWFPGSDGINISVWKLPQHSAPRTRKPLNITSLPWILPGERFRVDWLHY